MQEELHQFYPHKLKRGVLPSIGKGKESDFGTVPWKKLPVQLVKPPPRMAPCIKKGKGHSSRDITPWVGDSPLDSSVGVIPQSLEPFPSHTGSRCCVSCSTSEPRGGLPVDIEEQSNVGGNQDWQVGMGGSAPKGVKAFLTQRCGKDDGGRRKPRGKVWECRKLPPVQNISNLSFSRNFTFSFFQLPLHQSQRQRAQSTHGVYLKMKQIRY